MSSPLTSCVPTAPRELCVLSASGTPLAPSSQTSEPVPPDRTPSGFVGYGIVIHWRPGMTGEIQTCPPHGAMAAAATLAARSPGRVTLASVAAGQALAYGSLASAPHGLSSYSSRSAA